MTSHLSLNTGQAEGRAAQERRSERCEHRRRQAQEGRARRPLRSPAPPGDAPPTSTAARALDEARLRSGHARDCTNVLPELLTELLLMGSVCARVAPHEMHGWWSWFWTVLFQRGRFVFSVGGWAGGNALGGAALRQKKTSRSRYNFNDPFTPSLKLGVGSTTAMVLAAYASRFLKVLRRRTAVTAPANLSMVGSSVGSRPRSKNVP